MSGRYKAIPQGADMLWYQGYTPDIERYRLEHEKSSALFKAHGLTVIPMPLLNVNDWMGNCIQRCQLLWKEAIMHPKAFVGMLDTDLKCQARPDLMLTPFAEDVMVSDLGNNVPQGRKYSAGIVCFAPTPDGRRTLQHWAEDCTNDLMHHAGLQEQFLLFRAIEQCRPQVLALPTEYNHVPSKGEDLTKMVVIHTKLA